MNEPITPPLEDGEGLQVRLCIGERLYKGKKVQAWLMLDSEGRFQNDEQYQFWNKAVPGVVPGEKVQFRTADNGAAVYTKGPKGPQHLGMWPDSFKVAEWQALHRAANITHKAALKRQRDQKLDRVLEGLEPLRRAYKRSSPQEQAALIALVIGYIQKWNKD